MEDDIEWAVRRRRDNRSGGPSEMRVEHLQQWLWEARKADEATAEVMGSETMMAADMETLKEAEIYMETEATGPLALSHWKRVVVLIQADFQEGRLEEESIWQAVVLIPKGGGH